MDGDKVVFEYSSIASKLAEQQVRRYSYFMKSPNCPLNRSNINEVVTFGVFEGKPLDHLLRLMNNVYVPLTLASNGWPENARKDLASGTIRFMAAITEITWQQRGHTKLYLPVEDLSDTQAAAQDSDLVRRLDSLLSHWTRQIKDLTAASQASEGAGAGVEADSAGPLNELAFWVERFEDSNRLVNQLESERVAQVLKVLSESKGANPQNVKTFGDLRREIEQNKVEAENNVRFLSTLRAPCERLAQATPAEIPSLLPDILNRVRFISMYSQKYNSADRITALLRKIANELIRRCRASIDLEKIWAGDVMEPQERLREAVAVGKAWHATFEATQELVRQDEPEKADRWACSSPSLFAQVDAFGQRCTDLLAVCSSQEHFGAFNPNRHVEGLPKFGGAKSSETLESLGRIETLFLAAVHRLKNANDDESMDAHALDVKSPGWHDHFSQFRNAVGDFERMYRSVVDAAIDATSTVQGVAEVLDAFYVVCRRTKVRAHLDTKAMVLKDMLLASIAAAKHEHEQAASNGLPINVPLQMPTAAGEALWLKGLSSKLRRELAVLDALWYLPLNRTKLAAMDEFQARLNAGMQVEQPVFPEILAIQSFEITMRSVYTAWANANIMRNSQQFPQKLNVALLRRYDASKSKIGPLAQQAIQQGRMQPSMGRTGDLDSNFPTELLAVLNEVYYFERIPGLGFSLPFPIQQVHQRREELRVAREFALRLVRDYNRAHHKIRKEDKQLCSEYSNKLDDAVREFQEGDRLQHTWEKHNRVNIRLACDKCASVFDTVSRHQNNEKLITELTTRIQEQSLIALDYDQPLSIEEFEAKQEQQRLQTIGEIVVFHMEIVRLVQASLRHFRDFFGTQGTSFNVVTRAWQSWVKERDLKISAALRKVVQNSLTGLQLTLTPSSGAKSSDSEAPPLFRTIADIEPNTLRPIFEPSAETFSKVLRECTQRTTQALQMVDTVPVRLLVQVKKQDERDLMDIKAKFADQPGTTEEKEQERKMKNVSWIVEIRNENYGIGSGSRHSDDDASDMLANISSQIQAAQQKCALTMKTQLDAYREQTTDLYHPPLCQTATKAEQLKKYFRTSTERGVEDIKQDVNNYSKVKQEFLLKETKFVMDFVEGDFSKVKDAYQRHTQEWIDHFLHFLRQGASSMMVKLVEVMRQRTDTFAEDPVDVDHLVRLISMFEEATRELPQQKARVGPIQERFAVLAEFSVKKQLSPVVISEQDAITLELLPELVAKYEKTLTETDEKLKMQKKMFKLRLEKELAALVGACDKFFEKIMNTAPIDPAKFTYNEVNSWFSVTRVELDGYNQKEASFAKQMELFKLESEEKASLVKANAFINSLEDMWKVLEDWDTLWLGYQKKEFAAIAVDELEDKCGAYFRLLNQKREEHSKRPVWITAKAKVDSAKIAVPVLRNLGEPALRERHWNEIKQKATEKFDQRSASFTLETIFRAGLVDKQDMIDTLAQRAKKEARVEESIKKIDAKWSSWALKVIKEEGTEAYKVDFRVSALGDIFEELDLDMQEISNHKSTPFHAPFADEISQWESTLDKASQGCQKLRTVQKSFFYLYNIFQSEQIQQALPQEARAFQGVHERLQIILRKVIANPIAVKACADKSMLPELEDLEKILEKIQKEMQSFMHEKRKAFARFFFITDEDLLEILGRSRDAETIRKHLKKLFEGLHKIDYKPYQLIGPDDKPITTAAGKSFTAVGMRGKDDEYLPFLPKDQIERVRADVRVHYENNQPKWNYAKPEKTEQLFQVPMTGEVEIWFKMLELRMRETIMREMIVAHTTLEAALVKPVKPVFLKDGSKVTVAVQKQEWIRRTPGQLSITASQLKWSRDVTAALLGYQDPKVGRKKMESLRKDLRKHTSSLAKMVRKETGVNREKLKSLITIEVHNRDVVDQLYKSRVGAVNHFAWSSQLRFGWDGPDGLDRVNKTDPYTAHVDDLPRVRAFQTETVTNFEYEYQGNNDRLVVTPLTDKCYMTLTLALHLGLGGSPQGPAGTGKTETTKDLGKGLGKFVLVTNCSESHNYENMQTIFSGLGLSGCWGCFDEFNRIRIEVLSVVATQAQALLEACKQCPHYGITAHVTPSVVREQRLMRGEPELEGRRPEFVLSGESFEINPAVGIFITMNPTYAGRTELPDNLKSLFRPVAMMLPDFRMICEIMLLSNGFKHASDLAKRVTTLFDLMTNQLSKRDHYDFTLRSIKSVLNRAGILIKEAAEKTVKLEDGTYENAITEQIEMELVQRAIYDMNMPKFVGDDIDLFSALLMDLFPNVALNNEPLDVLVEAINTVLASKKLQDHPQIIKKCIQLYETKLTRHGYMLVGHTMGGKSTAWKVLFEAMTLLNKEGKPGWQKVIHQVINPKSISINELYGWEEAGEWRKGVLADVMRTFCSEDSPNQRIIVLDGPVDTLWIESMNTVLDDNKMLSLTNGDRISLPNEVSLLFEVQDLAVASPATVSRAGIIYLDSDLLGWKPYALSWADRFAADSAYPVEVKESLVHSLNAFVSPLLEVKRQCKELIQVSDTAAVISLTKMFDAQMAELNNKIGRGAEKDVFVSICERIFAFSLVWSIGATVNGEYRPRFDRAMRDIENLFPSSGLVYDYGVSYKNNSVDFVTWESSIPQLYVPPQHLPFHRIIVPTVDTERHAYILKLLVRNRIHAMAFGETGTGKTCCIASNIILSADQASTATLTINFSAQTSSIKTQQIIESKAPVSHKNIRKPEQGKQLIVFCDDFNMPKKEEFGAQPPLELLRQFLDYGSWYGRSEKYPGIMEIHNTQLLGAMGPPSGGRSVISPRLLSKFHSLNFVIPDDDQIARIYTSLASNKLSQTRFGDDVSEISDALVAATLDVYRRVQKDFVYAPDKPHYLFNLRDVSKVWQGIYQFADNPHAKKEVVLKLWYHECCRVFRDRLTNLADLFSWRALATTAVESQSDFSCQLKDLCRDDSELMYLALNPNNPSDESPAYTQVLDKAVMKRYFESRLEEYNEDPKRARMNLVLFTDAVEHICRVHRIVRLPQGHALLVGVGGSGRHSLIRLAAFLASAPPVRPVNTFQVTITKQYNHDEFRSDLKELSLQCGVRGTDVVFTFADTDAISDSFFEDVCSLMSSGEVPNLFQGDDLANLITDLRPSAKNEEPPIPNVPDIMYDYFLGRVKEHLHICVCVSPIGSKFRELCKQYPALVNNVTMDWFHAWPTQALKEVADKLLADSTVPEDKRDDVAKFLGVAHQNVVEMSERMKEDMKRYNYVTPTNYLELVKGYKGLLASKEDEIERLQSTLEGGLGVLEDSKERVKQLSEEIKLKAIAAEEAAREAMASKQEAEEMQEKTLEETENVKRFQITTEAKQFEAQKISKKAQELLRAAEPALRAAQQAVDQLDPQDVGEVKRYTTATEHTTSTMITVLSMINPNTKAKMSWAKVQEKIGKADFVTQVQKFGQSLDAEKGELPPAQVLKRIDSYVKNDEFKPELMMKKSRALGNLSFFINAVSEFAEKVAAVAPTRFNLANAQRDLEQAEADLKAAEDKLAALQAKSAELLQRVKDATERAHQQTRMMQEAQARKARAEDLLKGLEGEEVRWRKDVARYSLQRTFLVGDSLFASSFLAYCGPFPAVYRSLLAKQWIADISRNKITLTDRFNFVQFMTDEDDIAVNEWVANQLPPDQFSTENGVIVTCTNRWPLLIDPQDQGNRWIREMYSQHSRPHNSRLYVMDPATDRPMAHIEKHIEVGHVVLFEKVTQTLDPSLEGLLTRDVRVERGTQYIILDSKRELHKDFRFFLTTKMGNPHYTPEVSTKVTIVNFTVSYDGLAEQLLQRFIREEDPESAEQKVTLQKSTADAKKMLVEMQGDILTRLAAYKPVEGQQVKDITDDVELIQVLQHSAVSSKEINDNMAKGAEIMYALTAKSDVYKPIGKCAAVLYFVLADLAAVDSMYQFSLEAYVSLFVKSIQTNAHLNPLDENQRKVDNINRIHMYEVYKYACNSLFERHKPLLQLHLTAKIKMSQNTAEKIVLDEAGWRFFLKGSQTIGNANDDSNPGKDWISKAQWDDIKFMEGLACSGNFVKHFCENISSWRRWSNTSEPENSHAHPMPGEFDKTHPLLKLLIVKTLRPDRMTLATTIFVRDMMDKEYAQVPVFSSLDFFDQTNKNTPAIFILSPGFDPTPGLRSLHEAKGIKEPIAIVSLGEGQDKHAEAQLVEAAKHGRWLFLANCHLCSSWLPTLEKKIEEAVKTAHEDFRLWLSSDPTDKFPIPLLQRCVKATTEAPRGIKPNLRRLLDEENEEDFDTRPASYRRLVFSMCWFHTILLERKKFKTLGWNVAYDFNDSDFKTSLKVLRMYLEQFDDSYRSSILAKDPEYQAQQAILKEQVEIAEKAAKKEARALKLDAAKTQEFVARAVAAVTNPNGANSQKNKQPFPWEAVRYLVSRAIYGGRVTEDRDLQVVSVYCSQYLNPLVVGGAEFKLAPQIPSYSIPQDPFLKILKRLVSDQFTDKDPPEAFGQHVNAAISSQIQEGHALVRSLVVVSGDLGTTPAAKPNASSKGNQQKKKEEESGTLKVVAGIEVQIPELLDMSDVLSRKDSSPLHVVLVQEMQRYNDLIRRVRQSIKDMRSSLLGEVVMTDEVERNVTSIDSGAVPKAWQVAYPSVKPLASWVIDLRKRIDQLSQWVNNGQPPSIFWLGGLTYPTGYLTALKQRAARDAQVPIDRFEFDFEPMPTSNLEEVQRIIDKNREKLPRGQRHDLTAYISGISLEGAKWDLSRQCLVEPIPMELRVDMPVIRFVPYNTDEYKPLPWKTKLVEDEESQAELLGAAGAGATGKKRRGGDGAMDTGASELIQLRTEKLTEDEKDKGKVAKSYQYFATPLYMYPVRTGSRERPSFMCPVFLWSGAVDVSHWIKRGTALLLSTDE